MKKLRLVLVGILLGIIAISLLSLLLPEPPSVAAKQYYSPFATIISLVDVLSACGGSILFLMALRNFKPELKPAYRLMAFSSLAVGLGLLVFPYIEYYNAWDNVWLNMSSYLQYLVGAPLMYLGIRRFYKLLGLKSKLTAPYVLAVVILVLWAVHALIPNDNQAIWPFFSRHTYDVFEVVTIIPAIFYIATLGMVLRIRNRTGEEYAGAMGWLTTGLFFYVWITVSVVVLDIIGYENWYFDTRFITAPAIAGDLSFLVAGYCFNAVGYPHAERRGWLKRLFGNREEEAATSTDIIIYVAEMTSDKHKIDPYLDDMRAVTARKKLTEALNSEDQRVLRDVYLKIEDYLVTGDPLRKFDRDKLRTMVGRRLQLDERGDTTFWPTLKEVA
jgi:hypothetical protein